MANYRYHLRCTSLPSASHPLANKIEEDLNILRCWVDSTSSPLNTEKLHVGICHLTSLYESVDDLLHLPHIQQVLVHHRDENFADKVLDGSLRLLDVSSTIKDVLLQMKEHAQQTQSVLRRRRGEFKLRNEIDEYMHARRKINKVIHKCLGNLRKIDTKNSLSSQNADQDLVAVVHVLKEVETLTLSICETLLWFLSGSRTSPKPSGWFLVSNLMHKKRIICEEQHQDSNEVELLQNTMLALSSHKYHEVTTLQKAQIQLEVLETSIKSLEEGLECVFRWLIKTRVSVLNIFSN